MASKKDLQQAVAFMNEKYCKGTKNEFVLSGAYGGYKVELTGKRDKRSSSKWLKGSIGSGRSDVTYGFSTPTKTLQSLYEEDAKGRLKSKVSYWEKHGRYGR